jgi:Putative transposase
MLKAVEHVACSMVRGPLSLQKLVYLDGQRAVLYRGKMNPSLGRNFEALDPPEWLARLADHMPDPGKHRTLTYGHYANRVRGERAAPQQGAAGGGEGKPTK